MVGQKRTACFITGHIMGIEYVFVDTCVLADILAQYNPLKPHERMAESQFLKTDMVRMVNKIVEDENGDSGYIVASSFAFVELINKIDTIFSGNMKIERMMSIMSQPPSWLIIEPMNEQTANFFCDIPNVVNGKNVSSDDSVHVATALQRGDELTFLTTDHILKNMVFRGITFLDT